MENWRNAYKMQPRAGFSIQGRKTLLWKGKERVPTTWPVMAKRSKQTRRTEKVDYFALGYLFQPLCMENNVNC